MYLHHRARVYCLENNERYEVALGVFFFLFLHKFRNMAVWNTVSFFVWHAKNTVFIYWAWHGAKV